MLKVEMLDHVARSPHARRGLTLLELLLVVFILSMVAFSAISLTNTLDEQSRYEASRDRREFIRAAIVGRPGKSLSGNALAEGFVADVGILPANLNQLVTGAGLPAWSAHPLEDWPSANRPELWFGFRGPYLQGREEQVGSVSRLAFRDGWGNRSLLETDVNLDPNFGWNVPEPDTNADGLPDTNRVLLQSFGADGVAGNTLGTTYAADLPEATVALVDVGDYLVDPRDITLTVTLTGGDGSARDLFVRLYYPQLDAGGNLVVGHVDSESKSVSAMGVATESFTFTSTSNVPWGARLFAVVEDSGTSDDIVSPSENSPFSAILLPRARQNLLFSWKLGS